MRKFFPLLLSLVFLGGCQTARPPAPSSTAAPEKSTELFWPEGGVFPGKGRVSSWPGFKAKNVERRTLFAQRKSEDQHAIVFVGDSITEGWHSLPEDFADLGVKVANRGIGGDTTPNLLYRLQEDILSLHPSGLVILIGTNDLGEHTLPADIAANLRELHKRVRAAYPKIPIAWCLVMPRGDPAMVQPIQELDAGLREIIRTDSRITLCDTFAPLALQDNTAKPEDFAPDLLHLNEAGYAVFRNAVHSIVSSWKLGAVAK